jgi:glycosyltransferase involved in cell wall biosynthesis
MKNKIITSIVIRTHNHEKLLERLLKKIKSQKKFKDYEIVLVDSSSKDNTLNLAKKYGCRIINIAPKDFSHAYTFNLGAKKAKGEIIFYVSVDVIPKNNLWAHNLIKHFKNKKIGGVFSRQIPIPNFNTIEEFKMKKMFPEKEIPVVPFSNASGALRKSIWKKIKYDEKIPFQYIGGEDQQLIIEGKKRGYKFIYEPTSIVYHSHKYLLKYKLHLAYMIEKNKQKVKKWNKNVGILSYNKKDLVKYLILKRKFKELIFDLIIGGILIRIAGFFGKINRVLKISLPFNSIKKIYHSS